MGTIDGLADVIRNVFKDKKDFEISQKEIEIMEALINAKVDEKLQRLEMDKERALLENQKLEIELREISNRSLITTEKTTFFYKDFIALNGHNGDYNLITSFGPMRITKDSAAEVQAQIKAINEKLVTK